LSRPIRLLAAALFATLAGAAPLKAQDAEFARIGQMQPRELTGFIGTIVTSVGRDTLQLQPAAGRGDCAELARASNAFSLAYRMLEATSAAVDGKTAPEVTQVRVQAVQARVITFASRVRAEEWFSRLCTRYVPTADNAGDPRYVMPDRIATREFSRAIIDMRQAAEANFASVMVAGRTKRCPEVRSALQSVQLFIPYLEKLVNDVRKRPQALGPTASRRALEAMRGQLVTASNRLYTEVGPGCAAAPPVAPDEEQDQQAPRQETPEPGV